MLSTNPARRFAAVQARTVISSSVRRSLQSATPCFWPNPHVRPPTEVLPTLSLRRSDMTEAVGRFAAAEPLVEHCFPDTRSSCGRIESPLRQARHAETLMAPGAGTLWFKCDHDLPVAGSVKARGGLHEVLHQAASVATAAGLGDQWIDSLLSARSTARSLFERHEFVVGSTGNLGLSIGLFARAFGFRATVHMSMDAREWKKQKLREAGATVIEHRADYSAAVAAGRAEATRRPQQYFVDDERSRWLFLGYSVAALELKRQLDDAGVRVDADHPLFVYVPCGVGGAPGGICFGLKHVFGEHVHCFFAEPVRAPCMLFALADDSTEDPPSVAEIGLDLRTEADGLAVGRASAFVAGAVRRLVDGCFTVTDDTLFAGVYAMERLEGLRVEPSAAAALPGPRWLTETSQGQKVVATRRLGALMANSHHVVWTTGGRLLPAADFQQYWERGAALARSPDRRLDTHWSSGEGAA
jgi:D-serine dehydratase